jgi:hypothetical protein
MKEDTCRPWHSKLGFHFNSKGINSPVELNSRKNITNKLGVV